MLWSMAAEVRLLGFVHCARRVDHRPMAKTTITQVTDDIDGSKDAHEVLFAFDGTEYTVDLGKKNRTALQKALQPYIDAGTKVSKRTPSSRRSSSSSRKDFSAIRAWARENGHEVSERGRIPKAIIEAYEISH